MAKVERETSLRESSAIVLARVAGQARAFVADEDDAAIAEVDLEKNEVVSTTPVGTRPRDLLVLADGRIAATLPEASSVAIYARLENGQLQEMRRVKTPADPVALALDPKDTTLYLTTGSSHSLVAFSVGGFEERARTSLGREPRAALVSSDGARVFVSHAIESFVSIAPAAGEAGPLVERSIDNHMACSRGGNCSGARFARNAQAIARFGERGIVIPAAQSLPVDAGGVTKSSICASILPDGKNPKQKSGYGSGIGEQGPPVTNDLATLDGSTGALYGSGFAGMTAPTCLLPRAAIATSSEVLVACLGSSRIARFRPKKGFDFGAQGKPSVEIFDDGIRRTATVEAITVPAGPTGIAIDREGRRAIVWSSFARSVTRLDLGTTKPTASLDLPRKTPREASWLRGRELFFTNGDKRIASDGRTCASCHVDGLDDDLTWSTPMGPRRTRMLRGEVATGPYGWKGEHTTIEEHVKQTVMNLGGTGLPADELANLLGYVTSLARRPSSAPTNEDENRGKELFAAAECVTCHTAGTSDRALHDVGTGGAFMTPTLASIGTRGGLMHDGRYRSLDELLTGATKMGRGSSLSPEERRSLIRYLETL